MTPKRPPRLFWPLLLGAVVYAGLALAGAWAQVGRPFPGFFVLWPRMVDAVMLPHWSGPQAGIHAGDVIVAMDGRPVANGREVHRYVARQPVGRSVEYDVRRSDGRRLKLRIQTQTMTATDWLKTFAGLLLAGVLHLLIGAVVSIWRPDSSLAWRHWWFCLAIGVYLVSLPGIEQAQLVWAIPGALAQGLVGVAAFRLASSLPRPWPVLGRVAWLEPIICLLWSGLVVQTVVGYVRLAFYGAASPIFALSALGCVLIVASSGWGWLSQKSTPQERSLASIVLVGAAAAFLPSIIVTVIALVWGRSLPYAEVAYLGLLLFPVAIANAIVRRQLFGLQLAIRRATFSVTLFGCLAGLYLGLSAIGGAWLARLSPDEPGGGLPGLLAAAMVAVAFQPLQAWLQQGFRRLFLGRRRDLLQLMSHFPPSLPTDPAEVARSLALLAWRGLDASWVHVRLLGEQRFAVGPVPEWAEAWRPAADHAAISEVIETEAGNALVLDLRASHGREGSLLIGPSQSGMGYVLEERAMLSVLAVHAAVALHAAKLFRQRVQLSVKTATAEALAMERGKVLKVVLGDLHEDLAAIRAAAAAMRHPHQKAEAFAIVRASLARVTRYLDARSAWLRTEPVSAEAVLGPAIERAVAAVTDELHGHGARLDVAFPAEAIAVAWETDQLEWLTTALLRAVLAVMAPGADLIVRLQPLDDVLVISASARLNGDAATLLESHPDRRRQLRALGLLMAADLIEPKGGRIVCHASAQSALIEAWLPLKPTAMGRPAEELGREGPL